MVGWQVVLQRPSLFWSLRFHKYTAILAVMLVVIMLSTWNPNYMLYFCKRSFPKPL